MEGLSPVLVVEGVAYEVASVQWSDKKPSNVIAFTPDKKAMAYVDVKHALYAPPNTVSIDMSECLKFPNTSANQIYKAIEDLIERTAKDMDALAIEYIESDSPFESDKRKEYFKLQQKIIGLFEANEIVSEYLSVADDVEG